MNKSKTGTVYLVGAGPGDPGLITVRGRQLIESSDAIVYDHLVHPALLDLAPPAAEKIYVGKSGSHKSSFTQPVIDRLLVRLAKKGKRVVRLKGGDPFVYARGGEEACALQKAGVPIEIVPGITAGFGALAYAGIPLTHRDFASDVTFITAHENPARSSKLNWKALGSLRGTMVIYMGIRRLEEVTNQLVKFGRPGRTPAAVIMRGTTTAQKTILGTLASIAQKAKGAEAPAVIVIGEVVKLARVLRWFEKKPLFGKTVMVTRSRPQAGVLRTRLEALGARVVEFPAISIEPVKNFSKLDEAISEIDSFDAAVFTSENGVSFFVDRLFSVGFDIRRLHRIQIIAIGPGTEKKLREFGVKADLVPPVYSTEGLFDELKRKSLIRGRRFLLLRTNIAPDALRAQLVQEGGEAEEVAVYETKKPALPKNYLRNMMQNEKVDFVTFTSSSTAQHFFELWKPNGRKLKSKFISIGPVTSGTIRKFGHTVYREAEPHTIDALVQAVAGRN